MKEIVYQGVRRGKEVGGGKIYAGQATTHAEKEEEEGSFVRSFSLERSGSEWEREESPPSWPRLGVGFDHYQPYIHPEVA